MDLGRRRDVWIGDVVDLIHPGGSGSERTPARDGALRRGRGGGRWRRGPASEEAAEADRRPITKADFYELGLTGGADSAQRRETLLKKLGLPERMTANAMLEAINLLYDRETFLREFAPDPWKIDPNISTAP